ncbi:unnamed protein product [Orchesella dallaii]|uniref:Kynurenine formamidase n=1 Tax=Orchesella dallaii TaxID=48710 RepID=A0ABP1Q6J4_9HEXA
MFSQTKTAMHVPGAYLLLLLQASSLSYSLANTNSLGKPEYIDLSYVIDDSTIFYPGQRFDYDLFKDVEGVNKTDAGFPFWFAMFSFCMGEHGGTHVDAPFHFNNKGWKLSEIQIKRLSDVPAALIDVERYVFALRQPDTFTLDVHHILEHEAKNGPIPTGGILIVRTGWSRFWPDKQKYLLPRSEGGTVTYNFPGISGDAARWLVSERRVVGVGIDTASIDIGNVRGHNHICHFIFCGNQVYLIENVANLDYLMGKMNAVSHRQCNLHLFVLPMKSNGTGGVARVLAYCKGL